MSKEDFVRYDVFICYYSGSGIDFARHLKKRLSEFGINAFLDEKDIPKSIKRDTDKWRNHIDRALISGEKFILIMTLGFNIRKEVIRELELAMDYNKEQIYCKHDELPESELLITIKNKNIDLSNFQYISFKDEPDLLRKLGAELLGLESSKKKESIFINTVNQLINSEGNNVRSLSNPMIEMFIGPNTTPDIYLEANIENRDLVNFLSNYIYSQYTRVTRNWYDFDTYDKNEYGRVHTNGFFHIIKPLVYDSDKNLYYLESILSQIMGFLISCNIIMKYKSITKEHSIYIIIRNVKDINILYGPAIGVSELYFRVMTLVRNIKMFSNGLNEISYKYSFIPNKEWSNIKDLIVNIYKDICIDLDILELNETDIKKRIYTILKYIQCANINYDRGNIKINRINIEEFKFTKEEMGIK